MIKYFTHTEMGCDRPQLYWGSVVGSVLVAILLTLLMVQSWYDRQAAERYSYNHLTDAAHQIEKSITTLYGTHQLLADAIAARFRRAATAPIEGCNPICDAKLHIIQERFDRLLPTADMLVLDAGGETLAETVPGMRTGLLQLPKIVDRLQAGEQALVMNGRNNRNQPSFIMGKSLLDRRGKLQAMLVSTLPFAELATRLKLPELGEQGVISILDQERRLIVREPEQYSVALGETVPAGSEPRTALNRGSFVVSSSLDGVERLMVRREIPFNLAEGGLTLLLGMSVSELLAGW